MGLQTTMPHARRASPRGWWYQPKSARSGVPTWTGTASRPRGAGCGVATGLLGEDAAWPDGELELLDRQAELAVLGGRGLGVRLVGGGSILPGLLGGLVIDLHGQLLLLLFQSCATSAGPADPPAPAPRARTIS